MSEFYMQHPSLIDKTTHSIDRHQYFYLQLYNMDTECLEKIQMFCQICPFLQHLTSSQLSVFLSRQRIAGLGDGLCLENYKMVANGPPAGGPDTI